jgi:tetratricopeptide (TPR) repeat protein
VNEAVALSEVGRYAQAEAAEKQAVRLLRATRRAPGDEIAPLLAKALMHHSSSLAALGDLAGALRDAEEAFQLAQQVAATGPGHPELLPSARASLAFQLLKSGRAADAVPHIRAAADATAVLPEGAVAWIQGTLAQVLAAAGEDAEASAVSDRARIALQRRVGATTADAGLDVEQARVLTNHANRLQQAGRWQEAVDTVTEAVARHRALAARNRLRRLPDLAMVLTNQAIILAQVSRWAESLAASKEAVALQREISTADPVAGRPGLASALSSYATGLAAADRAAEARPLMAESLEIRRALVAADRDAHLGKLAEAVSNYAFLAETGEEKLRLYEEAVRLRRELSAQHRAVHLPWLVRVLNLLATQLAAMGRPGPALDAGREAVELARESFAANRAGFLPHHAFLLREQARRLDEARQSAAAIALGAEAVAVCREAVGANRYRELPGLATALNQQADRILALPAVSARQAEEAAALQSEAAALLAEYDRG